MNMMMKIASTKGVLPIQNERGTEMTSPAMKTSRSKLSATAKMSATATKAAMGASGTVAMSVPMMFEITL